MATMSSKSKVEEVKVPFIGDSSSNVQIKDFEEDEDHSLSYRVWIESKKLWSIVGPAIFSRIASYSMLVVSQAFAGHNGDLELAAMTIATSFLLGLLYGFMLGLASALETLCGQAYGARKYYMLGVHLQRSFIVLFLCCVLTMPIYIFATPILKLLGQPYDIAERSGILAIFFIPLHFSYAFVFPLQMFLQCQLKNKVTAWVNFGAFALHVFLSWLVVVKLDLGLVGVVVTLNFTRWLSAIGLFAYSIFGGCPSTWSGFSFEAFSGLWEFVKLSISSGIMLCLENWYRRILIMMTGNLKNAAIAVDALSVWVANELGARNGKAAKFASIVSVTQTMVVGLFFWVLIVFLHNKIALIWTTSEPVLKEVHKLSVLLAFTVLLNSVQPVLSGVAVGFGWQSYVAYINIGCYYALGLPLGIIMGWVFHCGVIGIWGGMIFGGTAIQTLILIIIAIRRDWEREAEKASMHVEKWSS